jgi:hypothetical protein
MYKITTYIYIRKKDNKCVHTNACGSIIGEEYEHDNPNLMPEDDWPYEIRDLRKN